MSGCSLWAFEVLRKHIHRGRSERWISVKAELAASSFHFKIFDSLHYSSHPLSIFAVPLHCSRWFQWRKVITRNRNMNDQMYKQNRRVMSNEYGQSSNQRTEKIHKLSVQTQRGRISSGSSDFIEYQSASSRILDTEPFIKRFYRNVVQFIFSQVSDDRKTLRQSMRSMYSF